MFELVIIHAPQYITLVVALWTLLAVVRDLMSRIDALEEKLDGIIRENNKEA